MNRKLYHIFTLLLLCTITTTVHAQNGNEVGGECGGIQCGGYEIVDLECDGYYTYWTDCECSISGEYLGDIDDDYEEGAPMDDCGVCDGDNSDMDECGVCFGDGEEDPSCGCGNGVDLGCGCGEGAPNECGNCDGETCEGGDCPSGQVEDDCGVCGGNNECLNVVDCDNWFFGVGGNKAYQLTQAGLAVLSGGIEIFAGTAGLGVTGGVSGLLIVDGVGRVAGGLTKAYFIIFDDEIDPANIPTSIGQAAGAIVDNTFPVYDNEGNLEHNWQAGLGAANDFVSLVATGGVGGPMSTSALYFTNAISKGEAMAQISAQAVIFNDVMGYGGLYDNQKEDCP